MDDNILPNQDDDSTLFICSGMQKVKHRFLTSVNEKHGSLQSCIRTNDLDLVGDGSHLTHFKMVGNFSFNCNDYHDSVNLWCSIIDDLGIKVDTVHIHPTQEYHKKIWSKYNYTIVEDSSCVWSDGNIGGYCCEMYVGELEIGNLVNTLEHSVDVGFGFERLIQVIEGKSRVDETSIFNQGLHPIVRDHVRTLELLWNNQIKPGSKNREYICRTLVRRTMEHITTEKFLFDDWIQSERELLEKKLKLGRKVYRRHKDKSEEWWWSTYGILPEELKLIKG